MEIEINIINVEDGDAFILTLKRITGEKALIVIDGGFKKYFDKRLDKRLRELLPEFNNRISLLVCTHYDDDHLSGIECLIEKYHGSIDEIWLHKANGPLNEKIIELNQNISQFEATHQQFLHEQANPWAARVSIIIEDYKHLVKVLEKIREKGLENKVVEATAGKKLTGFEELEVISPTLKFYNQNLDALNKDQLLQEHDNNMEDRYFIKEQFNLTDPRLMREWMKLCDPCNYLETSSISNGVTATNLISIVILLTNEVNGKKYLFCGDAGIETFEEHIPNWNEKLSDLYCLGLPHHGSKNNTSKRMLAVFKPKYVFVSASNKENRPSVLLKTCLTYYHSEVYITNSDPQTWYLKMNKDGMIERHIDQ